MQFQNKEICGAPSIQSEGEVSFDKIYEAEYGLNTQSCVGAGIARSSSILTCRKIIPSSHQLLWCLYFISSTPKIVLDILSNQTLRNVIYSGACRHCDTSLQPGVQTIHSTGLTCIWRSEKSRTRRGELASVVVRFHRNNAETYTS